MTMKVFAASREDIHQGWVWLQDANLPARSIVRLTNSSNGRTVYCEALQIDDNFLAEYNKSPRFTIAQPTSSIVMGAWFRAKLGGLPTQTDIHLVVSPANCCWGRFKACVDHPQIVVRLATWLAGIGLILGVIGFVLGVVSVWPAVQIYLTDFHPSADKRPYCSAQIVGTSG